MKRVFAAFSFLLLLACSQGVVPMGSPGPVHAGAFEGFGSSATGGSGYGVVYVTNTNNSGTGSLRAALEGTSNRIIRFSVSGTINLTSAIWVTGANITVDGFSAPSPGITITSSSDAFVVSGSQYTGPDTTHGYNIIFQGLRLRSTAGDAFQIAYNAHDIVIDHCSIDASGDGAVDITEGAYNVTVSYCIVSNTRGNGPFLLAYDSDHVSYHHNIMYGNYDRNPILTAGHVRHYSSGPQRTGLLGDVRYNVIWQYVIGSYVMSADGAVGSANIVGNIYRNNPSRNPSNNIGRSSYDTTARAHAYVAENVSVHDLRGTAYNYGGESNGIPDSAFVVTSANMQGDQSSPFPAPPITGPSSATQQGMIDLWEHVRATAGVINYFPDDSIDAATRAAISIPTVSVYNEVWNFDASPPASGGTKAPSSAPVKKVS